MLISGNGSDPKLHSKQSASEQTYKRSELSKLYVSDSRLTHCRVSKKVTHVVTSTSRTRTLKVRQAAKYAHIKIVNQQWLLNSMSKWEKEDEEPYLVSGNEKIE